MTGGNDAPTAGFAMEVEADGAPVFTVLVAVYNASATLSRCLDSLLGQTERSLQVVCIDDCSTDGSLDVLRRYAQADSRVEIVALDKNSGPAHARNAGLQRARGRYTAFVDSDDWLGTDVYTCSKCRESYVLVEGTPKENLWHYCPNCGAQMHEDDFCSYGERKEDKSE